MKLAEKFQEFTSYCLFCKRALHQWKSREIIDQTCPECMKLIHLPYKNHLIHSNDLQALITLEKKLSKEIPFLNTDNLRSMILNDDIGDFFGFSTSNYRINGLLLTNSPLKRIPEDFCNLTELQVLSIASNNLKELPRNFGDLNDL
ncbi:MAG: hypothetical protein ACXAC7_17775, partial [Candidatus Hodarchaeales archaeon]